jgi:hypothetical protein
VCTLVVFLTIVGLILTLVYMFDNSTLGNKTGQENILMSSKNTTVSVNKSAKHMNNNR